MGNDTFRLPPIHLKPGMSAAKETIMPTERVSNFMPTERVDKIENENYSIDFGVDKSVESQHKLIEKPIVKSATACDGGDTHDNPVVPPVDVITSKQQQSLAVFSNLYSGAQDNTMRSLIRNQQKKRSHLRKTKLKQHLDVVEKT